MRQAPCDQAETSDESLENARSLVCGWVKDRTLPAVSIAVSRHGHLVWHESFGRLDPLDDDSERAETGTIFLLASLTKPIVTSAFLLLVERGRLLLDEPVIQYVPEFGNRGKSVVRIRHLLTHTSGLPDMVPDNESLRAAHAPMSEFVKATCECGLLFEPGSNISYQSTGILMLAEIIQRLEGLTIREFLHRELFAPLGMRDTYLGIGHLPRERMAQVNLTTDQLQTDWHWNSPYWRDFGAPWGGLHSTSGDLVLFLRMMLCCGSLADEKRIFSPSIVAALTRDQTSSMERVPREKRASNRWGLGWRLHSNVESAFHFGDLVSERTFGHAGATGTVFWADPLNDLICVVLTTQPGNTCLERISNAVAAAMSQ